jgi:hypothetical protein
MKKNIFISTSDRESARQSQTLSSWFTVIHDESIDAEASSINPWNNDKSEYVRLARLHDDCVITLRPARYEILNDSKIDYEKGAYFLEITNQDGSMIYTSRTIYSWLEANKLAFFFKDISFTAACRVWKSKNI